MEPLRTSSYLQTVKRDDGFAVFHSLFGQLCHLNSESMDLINAFNHPAPADKIIQDFSNGHPEKTEQLLDEFRTRFFIVPENYKEYEAIERDKKFRSLCIESGYLVRALQLIISNKCNFGCKFCFFKDHKSASRKNIEGKSSNMQMSFEMAKHSIESILNVQQKHKHDAVNIEFFGGEPLMNWPVVKSVLDTFGKNGHIDFPKIDFSITTNGKAITKEMASIFKDNNVTVTVSYNFPTNHKEPDNKLFPNFKRVKESLDILKAAGNSLTFNTVMSLDALEHFDPQSYVELCKYYNVQMIGLILDLNLAFYNDKSNSEKAMNTIMTTYEYAKQNGIPVVGYWYEPFAQLAGHQALNFSSGFKCCPGEGCKLSVEPEGHVFVCKGCSEKIGHINNLEGVFANPKYKEYAFHAYRNAPKCEGCMIENFCSTGCMGSIERHYNTINAVDDPWCEVFKEITLRLIRSMSLDEYGDNKFHLSS